MIAQASNRGGPPTFGRGYAGIVNRFSATGPGSWLVKHLASRLDPALFRWTGGRLTTTVKPTLPMLALTTIGRRSGKPRTVQLAFLQIGDDRYVVASAMGQQKHPAWSYNLESCPHVTVQVRGERFTAHAERLTNEEKHIVWPNITRTIPQMQVYMERTSRDLKVYRLRRVRPLPEGNGHR